MDVHKRETQVCIVDAEGAVVFERRIRTERSRLGEVLGARGRRRILIEGSTESEWVAMAPETLGHEVVIADPNYTPMYATRTRRVKTDRREARALADSHLTIQADMSGHFRVNRPLNIRRWPLPLVTPAHAATPRSSSRSPTVAPARSSSAWAGLSVPTSTSRKATSNSAPPGTATFTGFASATNATKSWMASFSATDAHPRGLGLPGSVVSGRIAGVAMETPRP